MTAFTRKTLRQRLAKDMAGELFITGIAGSGGLSNKTYELAELVDSAGDTRRWTDTYTWRVATGEERRNVNVNLDNGRVDIHRTFATAVTATDEMEIHRYPPGLVNDAINDGLARCRYLRYVDITPVVNQTEYSLSAYPWIHDKSPIYKVQWRWEGTTGLPVMQDIEWWDVQDDGAGNVKLIIAPSPWQSGAQLTLRL